MNSRKESILQEVRLLLDKSTDELLNAKDDQLFDLIEPHYKLKHCETFLVKLINDINECVLSNGKNVSKGKILEIYNKYKDTKNANENRAIEIAKNIY